MENQHQLIAGYRDLTRDEIELINSIKLHASEVGGLCNRLLALAKGDPAGIDPRWIAIGQTDLQKGFMALVRAVARPETF